MLCFKVWKKTERASWISALKEGKLFASLTFEGTCNRNLFETWLAESLIPRLEPVKEGVGSRDEGFGNR